MPTCPECGEAVEEGFTFCPACGHDVDRGVAEATAGTDRSADTEAGTWGKSNADVGGSTGQRGYVDGDDGGTDERGVTNETTTSDESTGVGDTPAGRPGGVDGRGPTTDVDGPSPHTDGSLSFAVGYATRDSWDGVLLGAIIEFAGLIVPFAGMMVRGFSFRAGTAAARGQTEPPEFDEYGEMFVDGFRMAALFLLFGLVFGGGGAILAVLAGALYDLLGVLTMLVVVAVGLYAFPASLTTYAAFGSIEYAVSPSYAGRFATTTTYLEAFVVGVLFNAFVAVLTVASLFTIVGFFVVVPWALYAEGALWGYFYREAVAEGEVPPPPAEAV